MATTPIQTHPLLSVSFNAATDFSVLTEHCKQFAEILIEHDDPMLRLTLCGRLNACLRLLKPPLLDPLLEHVMDSLTVDTLPTCSTHFDPECTELCHYCFALTQVLLSQPNVFRAKTVFSFCSSRIRIISPTQQTAFRQPLMLHDLQEAV